MYVPIYDPEMKQQLKKVIEFGLKDNLKARIVDGSGKNDLQQIIEGETLSSQQELYKSYKENYELSQSDRVD